MNKEIALKVENLSKVYDLSISFNDNIREEITRLFDIKKNKNSKFVALNDISFTLTKGDVVGIIGENGAGKSTLLKIISEVTYPTRGEVTINGTVSSILEIGSGFHLELSGKENIYLSGSLKGYSKSEITKYYDEIVEFSGIEEFIETPVKKYSSGMFIRLAFSVATFFESDIIVLDEVLAVGDAEFKIKSLDRIRELAHSGRTVILVSHDLNSIINLCSQCIVLDKGRIISQGDPKQMVGYYMENVLSKSSADSKLLNEAKIEIAKLRSEVERKEDQLKDLERHKNQLTVNFFEEKTQLENEVKIIRHSISKKEDEKRKVEELKSIKYFENEKKWTIAEKAPGNEYVRLKRISYQPSSGEKIIFPFDDIEFEIEYHKLENTKANLSFMISYQLNTPVLIGNSLYSNGTQKIGYDFAPGIYEKRFTIPGSLLNNGIFSVDIFYIGEKVKELMHLRNVINFKVTFDESFNEKFNYSGDFAGPILLKTNWTDNFKDNPE